MDKICDQTICIPQPLSVYSLLSDTCIVLVAIPMDSHVWQIEAVLILFHAEVIHFATSKCVNFLPLFSTMNSS